MKNLSIKTKLLGSFSIIILLAIFNSVIVIWYVNMLSVNASQSVVMRQYDDSVYGLSLFDIGLTAALQSYIRSGNNADLARYRMIESEYQSVLQSALWLPLSQISFSELREAFVIRRELFGLESQAVALVQAGKGTDASAVIAGDQYSSYKIDFTNKIEDDISASQETITIGEIQRNQFLFQAKAISLVDILLLIVIGGGLVWTVSNHISRTLWELHDAAEAISHGETGRRVRVSSRDDVGRAAVAFNKMAVALDREKMDAELKRITSDLGE